MRNWVSQADVDAGKGPPGALTTAEKEELSHLRREVKVHWTYFSVRNDRDNGTTIDPPRPWHRARDQDPPNFSAARVPPTCKRRAISGARASPERSTSVTSSRLVRSRTT